jgi:AAA family ATP:ADP antiporter
MSSPASAPTALVHRPTWIERLVLLHPGEAPAFLWSAAFFFFLLFSYYLLRPVRDEMGIRGDLDSLPELWTITTMATLVATPLFAWLASRLPRRRFVPGLYRFFTVNLLLFWGLLAIVPAGPANITIGYSFFIWISVFNLLSTSVFWGFMADLFAPAQGKRLFGAIGVGGTLGAVAGSSVPATLSSVLGPVHLMLLAAIFLEVVTQCARRLCTHFGLTDRAHSHLAGGTALSGAAGPSSSSEPGRNVWAGFSLIAQSPYLQMMVVYMLLFTMTTTFLYFEQARILKETLSDSGARIELLARIDLIVNALTLVMQVFVTGRLLTFLGVMGGLLVLPALTVAGFAGLWQSAGIGMVMGFQTIRRATHFAVDRPTREVLYTVLGPDAKYKSKSFIDTFVYRGGDLAGAWGTALFTRLALSASLIAIPISLIWLGSAWVLGRMQRRVAAVHPAATGDATLR